MSRYWRAARIMITCAVLFATTGGLAQPGRRFLTSQRFRRRNHPIILTLMLRQKPIWHSFRPAQKYAPTHTLKADTG